MDDIAYKIFRRQNLFFHGPGGSGKSYCIKQIIKHEGLKHLKIQITSTTGKSAIDIGGRTIYSWAGIRLGKEPAHIILKKMNEQTKQLWRTTNVLIIDEISMMGKRIFELLHVIGCSLRNCFDKLFGGITVVFTGDLYQLPPINDKYIFKSSIWNKYRPEIIPFNTLYRFDDDCFGDILLRIRKGEHTEEDNEIMRTRVLPVDSESLIKPTILYSRKIDVNRININELNKIKEPNFIYHSKCINKSLCTKLLYEIPDTLVFRKGAQVMCTQNIPNKKLVNGSRGVVIECYEDYLICEFLNGYVIKIEPFEFKIENHVDGKLICSKTQIPLILAYALTIHKSQGATLDSLRTSIDETIFSPNMAYVALSRCRNLSSLYLDSYDPEYIYVDPEVIEYEKNIQS